MAAKITLSRCPNIAVVPTRSSIAARATAPGVGGHPCVANVEPLPHRGERRGGGAKAGTDIAFSILATSSRDVEKPRSGTIPHRLSGLFLSLQHQVPKLGKVVALRRHGRSQSLLAGGCHCGRAIEMYSLLVAPLPSLHRRASNHMARIQRVGGCDRFSSLRHGHTNPFYPRMHGEAPCIRVPWSYRRCADALARGNFAN